MQTTQVYDTLWRFAAARQNAYIRRLHGQQPYTLDPIIAKHRFTNCYRIADRVSQYLLQRVILPGEKLSAQDQIFRVLLFKVFNRIETWEYLEYWCGQIVFNSIFHVGAALDSFRAQSSTAIYSAAYMMPQPAYGRETKHANHLAWLYDFCSSRAQMLLNCAQMQQAYHVLLEERGVGEFLAFQYLIDLNYTKLLNFDENEFVVAGPGALDGISKCFAGSIDPVQAIRYATERQDYEFLSRGLRFEKLLGRLLHLIDVQNLFCEIDKYARVAHPEVATRRTNIKQLYRASSVPMLMPMLPQKVKW